MYLRIELDARLLARQASEEIVQRLPVLPAAMDAYATTFFDVRDRLDSKTYVVKKLLRVGGGLSDYSQNPESFLKSIAYFGGPECLDACLPYLLNGGQQLAQRTASDDNSNYDPLADRLGLLLLALNLPEDSKTSLNLVKAAAGLIQGLSENRPSQRWVGVFAQIVEPFTGEIITTGKQAAEDVSDRQAA